MDSRQIWISAAFPTLTQRWWSVKIDTRKQLSWPIHLDFSCQASYANKARVSFVKDFSPPTLARWSLGSYPFLVFHQQRIQFILLSAWRQKYPFFGEAMILNKVYKNALYVETFKVRSRFFSVPFFTSSREHPEWRAFWVDFVCETLFVHFIHDVRITRKKNRPFARIHRS